MEEKDVALKILHTADWHLGRHFPSFSEEDETKLTRARIEAVDRLFGLAESYAVNAVLCAGDLFDDPRPSEIWWVGLLRLLETGEIVPCFSCLETTILSNRILSGPKNIHSGKGCPLGYM